MSFDQEKTEIRCSSAMQTSTSFKELNECPLRNVLTKKKQIYKVSSTKILETFIWT